MTAIEEKALELVKFLNVTVAPNEAFDDGLQEEWPVDLVFRDDENANEFCRIMNELKHELEVDGHDYRNDEQLNIKL